MARLPQVEAVKGSLSDAKSRLGNQSRNLLQQVRFTNANNEWYHITSRPRYLRCLCV